MNKSKYFILSFFIAVMMSCYKDNSTVDTLVLSDIEVTIDNLESEVIDIEKNETLTIDPAIKQTGKELPLSYEWQINYEVVSTEKTLVYVGNELGSYPVRLEVSNDHGSAFKTFTLNVNSPYEQGVFVLTENPDGNGNIAFMRTLTDAEKAEGRVEAFENNCFTTNNPNLSLGKGVADVAKRVNQLYIASANEGKISVINTKTFQLETEVSAPEIPGFQPYRVNVPDNLGRSALILSKNGKVYKLATLEFLVLKEPGFPDDVDLAMKTQFVPTYNFTSNYFWDKNESMFYYKNEYATNSSEDTLSDQDLICFFATPLASYILTHEKGNPTKLKRTKFADQIKSMDYSDYSMYIDILEQDIFENSASTLKATSITVPNFNFNKLIYANDNKVYHWYYSGINLPTTPFIEIDSNNKILSMNISEDGKELYLAAYNDNASGLKGSMYIYNADNGALISKHENVFDKPVKVFYKKRD